MTSLPPPSAALANIPPPGFSRRFFRGIRAPVQGAAFLAQRPRLWKYALLPTLINLVVSVVVLAGVVVGMFYFLPWMYGWGVFSAGWWGATQKAAATIAALALGIASVVSCYLLVAGILAAFFFEALGRRIEQELGTPDAELVNVAFRIQVADALLAFLIVLPINLLCFLLGCIPVIGSVVGGALSLYVDSHALGFYCFDVPLSLRGRRLAQKRDYLRRHRPETLGIGLVVLAMTLVPILGSVMITAAVAGAVLYHHKHR